MSDVRGVRVTDDVVGPLVTGGVGMASADVFLLEMLELLERAKFICHYWAVIVKGEGDEAN